MKIGTQDISAVYLGNSEVSKVYLGTDEVWSSIGSLLLDVYTSAAAAYSLRKLNSSYTGNCVRVRRSSDNAEQDIGFVGNVLDESSLTSFVGVVSGFITTWYDQSGNGNDGTQTSTGAQPALVIAGVVVTTNGKPTVSFGDNDAPFHLFIPTGLLNGATALSYFQVALITDFGSSNAGVFGPSNTGGVGLEVIQHTVISRRTVLRVNGTIRNDNAGAAYQLWDDATQSLTSIFGNSADMTAYKNSSAVTLTSSAAMPSLNFNGIYSIGMYNSFATDMNGDIQELIIYNTNQTSNRIGIETNINSFYTIYS
jgi:hypothetical protein